MCSIKITLDIYRSHYTFGKNYTYVYLIRIADMVYKISISTGLPSWGVATRLQGQLSVAPVQTTTPLVL